MAPLKIKIHGRYTLERAPEIGTVSITARSISLSKMTTVSEVERISQKLHEMIAPLAIRTEDGAPAPDAAIRGWTVSPTYCHASEWFPDPRASSTQARTQANTQASAQASPQANPQASTQTSPQASTQTSPQASTQTSPQASTQNRPQDITQTILRARIQSIIEGIVEASNQESAQGHNQARIQALVGMSIQTSVKSIIDMIVEAGNRESAQAHNQARIQALVRMAIEASYRYPTPPSTQTSPPLCRNYSATIKLGVTFGNFAKLREFADQIAEIPEASIDEICWGLSEASYVLADAEVRERALHNALRLADDYAKSLGRDVVPVEIRPRRVKFEIPKQIMQTDPSIAPGPVQLVPRNLLFTNTVKVIFGPV
ncbi:hypothetical protein N7452_007313 [Penicillium brevicompactum]|uniref:DUF541 domain-containing protein n=1 Tax=Penicillium brevicompactum TaxID=5074 RepID=A0A9W9QF18_PENBR|nr:hypothetical protein N7452_007313 [Penicillium brevicompactum]